MFLLKKATFVLLGTFLVFFACKDSTADQQLQQQEKKWKTVMENHDVVMPMMENTNKTRRALKDYLATAESLPQALKDEAQQLIQQLDAADDGMMKWMNEFQQLSKLRADKSHQEILHYLEMEDKKIKQVGQDMTNSIQAGKQFLEKTKMD